MEDCQALLIATEMERIRWGGGDISGKVGELVNRIAAVDSSDGKLPAVIRDVALSLPQDEHFPTRLTTLFNKAVSVVKEDSFIRELFYLHPDVLADALIDFVRQDPAGPKQTEVLMDVFYPFTLSCYINDASSPQKIQGLRTAAAGIDNLRAQKGFSDIVRFVVDSIESQKGADRQYETLFPS